GRLALYVGRRAAFILLRLRLLALLLRRWRRGRRRWRLEVENADRNRVIDQFSVGAPAMDDREQQCRMDRDDDGDYPAAVASADIGAVGHGWSTRTPLQRCAGKASAGRGGPVRRSNQL